MSTDKIEPLSGLYFDRYQLVQHLFGKGTGSLDRLDRLMDTIDMGQVLAEAREWDESPRDFKITMNPVEEANYVRLPRKIKRELERIRKKIIAGKKGLVKPLTQYRRRFPEVPFVWNLLSIALANHGRMDEYEALVHETVQHFPDYLFGRIALANYCLKAGRHREIPAVLDNKMNIYDHYPDDGREFHYSEVRSFYTVVGSFYARENEIVKAIVCWNLVKQVDEEHGAHRMLAQEIIRSQLARVQGDMSQFLQKHGRPEEMEDELHEDEVESMEGVVKPGKFNVGDRVRVLPEIKDPDFQTDIAGWSGLIDEIDYDDQGKILCLVSWDRATLLKLGDEHIDKCEQENLNYERMYLYTEDLELLDYPEGVRDGTLLA